MPLTPTTWNPADKSATCVLSNGDLTATGNVYAGVRSVFGASTGKWYWELTVDVTYASPIVGVATSAANIDSYPGGDENGWAFYGLAPGYKYHASISEAYGAEANVGSVIGVALDLDAGTLRFYVNGADQGIAYTGISGTVYAMFGGASSGPTETATANFGGSPFVHTPPAGHNHGFGTGSTIPTVYRVRVNVKDAGNNNVAREVAICRRSPFTLVGTVTTNAVTGNAVLETPTGDEHLAIALPASGENLNALVHDRILPVLEEE